MIWSLFQAMQVIVAAMKRNYKYITKNKIDKEFLFFWDRTIIIHEAKIFQIWHSANL